MKRQNSDWSDSPPDASHNVRPQLPQSACIVVFVCARLYLYDVLYFNYHQCCTSIYSESIYSYIYFVIVFILFGYNAHLITWGHKQFCLSY